MATTPRGDTGRHHERLWSIAGRWATDGHVIVDPPVPVTGFDTYEVLAGGYFLVHHVDVQVGDQPCGQSRSSVSRTPPAMVS